MHDVTEIIKNVEKIYDSNTGFQVLKDFERVLDELDVYVYKNWEDGELASGPNIERHWVTCKFFWARDKMPDPQGGKRLLDFNCKVTYQKSFIAQPRKIKKPDDYIPGTRKGKLDRKPIWIVEIQMPKSLIAEIFTGYQEKQDEYFEENPVETPEQPQPADAAGAEAAPEEGVM